MCMSVLSLHVYVHLLYAWCLRIPEEGVRSPGMGVTGSWELSNWHWER